MSVAAAPLQRAEPSYRAQWAQRVVREKLARELNLLKQLALQPATGAGPGGVASFIQDVNQVPFFPPGDLFVTPLDLPLDPDQEQRGHRGSFMAEPPESMPHRICIVGAGVTGLYIAMILDSLEIPDLTYEILEASDRTGGRMYTHYFSEEPHDYYDIGAMRFPYIPIMYRTFKLFVDLGIPMIKYYLNESQGAVKYPTMYNDFTTLQGDPASVDPFHVSVANNGSVPNNTVDNVDDLLNDAFGKFKDEMARDFEKGFKSLMEFDSYSTREYLKRFVPPPPGPDAKKQQNGEEGLDFFTVQWLETNNTGSGLFDQAFSESVIDSFDFDAPQENDSPAVNGQKDNFEKWYCINGGTSLVTKAMIERIKQPVQKSKRVHKITQDKETNELTVYVAGEDKPRDPYTTIFNTTSLACLQRMDLTGITLHPSQKDAIRTLHYDDSAKVAIQFKYPWWITKCGIIKGGAASTDIPLRTCVYPSYNLDDDKDEHSILLCSYTWSQDATRIGSLINRKSPAHEEELKQLMISNLARLHQRNFDEFSIAKGGGPLKPDEVYKIINDAYVKHHAYSWSHDPYTSGAFALFGPGQFSNLYPYLSRPTADSRFHFCGEASSTHHAWIVGSLDSAVASVHAFLKRFKMLEDIKTLKKKWGVAEEVDDKVNGTLHLQVMLGRFPEEAMVQV